MTDKEIYTLSDGTRKIIGTVSEPIKLKLYYSRSIALKGPEQLRHYNNYYFYVQDLLNEYASLSEGKISLEIVDPVAFSNEEEDAIAYGLQRFPLNDSEYFCFGLVAQTELGKNKVIKFFEPGRQEFVEYDVSKLLTSLMQRDKKTVGVLSSLSVVGDDMNPYMMQMMQMQGKKPTQPWMLIQDLKSDYEVIKVEAEKETIPENIDFLMVIHPKGFGEKTLFAIDQYVMKGGRLIAFVDPHCLQDKPAPNMANPMMAMQHNMASELNALLRTWGVETRAMEIAGDPALGVRTQLRRNAPQEQLLTWMRLNEETVNTDQVMVAKLHEMQMLFPGVISTVADAGTKVTPLLSTTDLGGVWRADAATLRFPQADHIRKNFSTRDKPVMLSCLISGKLKSNFPNGIEVEEDAPVPSGEEAKEEKAAPERVKRTIEGLKETETDAMVVVVADVDMLADPFAYRKSFFGMERQGQNSSFVRNALDYMTGSGELISIRSRGRFSRPFTVVDEIEREADKETAAEVEQINAQIKVFQEELNALGSSATKQNMDLITATAMDKQKMLNEQVRKANKELRKVQAKKRERVSAMGKDLDNLNTYSAPAVILLFAVGLAIFRTVRAKQYAARRQLG
ncbi:MAG: GldG family protein [Planctomycetota bacterium]